jgi:hypothetical protein
MKNKKWLLLLIIAFPSAFWLILESSTIQSKKLPHYGPKTARAKGDTAYYKVNTTLYSLPSENQPSKKISLPTQAFVLSVLHQKYRNDAYRIEGFWEYLKYKQEKIAQIPFVFLCPESADSVNIPSDLLTFQNYPNIQFYQWPKTSYDSLWTSYFREKPYYIDYSFFILIDAQSHLRGYYDARYASEIKRLIGEYQHLRLKEEKQKLIESNEIKSLP